MSLKPFRRLARRRASGLTRVLVALAALVPASAWSGAVASPTALTGDMVGRAHSAFPAAVPVDLQTAVQELRAPATELPPVGGSPHGRAEHASSLVPSGATGVGPAVHGPERPAGTLRPHFATAPPTPA